MNSFNPSSLMGLVLIFLLAFIPSIRADLRPLLRPPFEDHINPIIDDFFAPTEKKLTKMLKELEEAQKFVDDQKEKVTKLQAEASVLESNRKLDDLLTPIQQNLTKILKNLEDQKTTGDDKGKFMNFETAAPALESGIELHTCTLHGIVRTSTCAFVCSYTC